MVAYYTIIEDNCEAIEGVEDVGWCVVSFVPIAFDAACSSLPLRAYRQISSSKTGAHHNGEITVAHAQQGRTKKAP